MLLAATIIQTCFIDVNRDTGTVERVHALFVISDLRKRYTVGTMPYAQTILDVRSGHVLASG